MDISRHIANTLKHQREIKQWSLSRAALETGVSKAMLGQIERQESSPTVAILWKIATGFNLPFSQLIVDPRLVGQHQAEATPQPLGAMAIFAYDDQLKMDYLDLRLAAKAYSESSPHEPGVIEHVVVLSGILDLRVAETWHHLTAGQGLRFCGDIAHGYYNNEENEVHFHSLIHYPATRAAGD